MTTFSTFWFTPWFQLLERIFPFLGIICLIVVLAWWIVIRRPPERFIKIAVWLYGSLFFAKGIIETVIQTWYWASDPLTHSFLPPRATVLEYIKALWACARGIHYAINNSVVNMVRLTGYVCGMWNRFLDNPLMSIVIVLFVIVVMHVLQWISRGRIFYPIEFYLGPLVVLVIGWERTISVRGIPINMLEAYFSLLLFCGIVWGFIRRWYQKKGIYISFLLWWVPLALLMILFARIYFGFMP